MFPPLKLSNNCWVKESQEKANAFAKCFEAKFSLPAETHELPFFHVPPQLANTNIIRTRKVKKELSSLRPNQATGPDGLGAMFLISLAASLALPIAMICRRLFNEGIWPQCWRLHWLIPLFKKGSVFDSLKYRDIHLTSIMSKTVERVIGVP